MMLADPVGSMLAPYVETGKIGEAGSWAVEGIGEDFIPPNADLSLVQQAYSIPDAESFATARELLRAEGILAGSSSGTLLAAALRYCRAQSAPKRVVTLRLRFRREIPVQGVQPTFLAQEGWSHPRPPRHRARRRRAPHERGHRDRRCARRTRCARCSRACARPTSRSFR